MQLRKFFLELSPVHWIIIIAAAVKFSLQVYTAPGYGYFFDELYTISLSRHLAFGYVDVPPLVPALVAISRAILGESLYVHHIFPALAGSVKLVFVCLITKEFGGKWFAVLLSALSVIAIPIWLSFDSIFCYDSIDQMILAAFLYTLVRFLRSGNQKLWLLLGFLAGVACMTKMTLLYLGPGFLVALLISKYRKDLLTPWPWVGGAICLVVVSPYLVWQIANHWPTLEYWQFYGTLRVYQSPILQYLTNVFVSMNVFLLPLWICGLYRIFRRFNGINYGFLGIMFLFTLVLMFMLHAVPRMLAELFIPLIAAGAVFIEEKLTGIRWKKGIRTLTIVYLLAAGNLVIPASLPILPASQLSAITKLSKPWFPPLKEFVGRSSNSTELLAGRLGWDEVGRVVADVYNELPAEDRKVAGIYADSYPFAGAVDLYGFQYGLPHAVSGHLTYYLWGPGYSWDVMIIVTGRTNNMSIFFDECEHKATVQDENDAALFGYPNIFVCREPKVSPEEIWSSVKIYR